MRNRQISAALLAVTLLFAAEGCKKRVPAPPPPPKKETPAPPPPPPKPRPTVSNFTVEPSTIERGQSATLRWSTQDATSVTIDSGVGQVDLNGSRSVSPSSTTNYTLTARGEGGTVTQNITLRVTDPPPPPPPPARTARKTISELLQEYGVQDAYFDYDKHDVREDARSVLTRNADLLKRIFGEVPEGVITIEGHCDERGSAEYNLGLGDRRSTAARDFLVQLGVPSDRLKTISYGKERPQCSEGNEGCWQKNRRAAFSGQ